MKIVTIGCYGFDEAGFFGALQGADVDLFCDVRQRRGLRGSTFAFANSKRLQGRLAELGIRYRHIKELAPSTEVRDAQKRADRDADVGKRSRSALSPLFVEAYREVCLTPEVLRSFVDSVAGRAVVALFCVERAPAACHRSVLADALAQGTGFTVEHITP